MKTDKPTSARAVRGQLGLNSLITILLAAALLAAINYFGYRHYVRQDLSINRYFEVSEKTRNLLRSLPGEVRVISCLLSSQLRTEIDGLLEEYKAIAGDKLTIERVDPAIEETRMEALVNKFRFDPRENVVIFEYGDRFKFLNDTQLADYEGPNMAAMGGQRPRMTAFKGEQQFTATILSLVEGKPAPIYFLTGHGEREIENASSLGSMSELVNRISRDNNTPKSLNLAETPAVPEDAEALVIAGPRSQLTQAEVDAIAAYLERRGKLLLFQDPAVTSGLEPLLRRYGMELQNNRVMYRAPIQGLGREMLISTALGTTFAEHPAVAPIRGFTLEMTNARSIAKAGDPANPNVAKVIELVKTPAQMWGETNLADPKPQFDEGTDQKGPLTIVSLYDGGEVPGEQVQVAGARIAVFGSSTFITNQNLDIVGLDLVLGVLNWMMKREMAIGISPKTAQEFGLQVSALQAQTLIWLSLVILPLSALLVGLFVWLSRRK